MKRHEAGVLGQVLRDDEDHTPPPPKAQKYGRLVPLTPALRYGHQPEDPPITLADPIVPAEVPTARRTEAPLERSETEYSARSR